MCQGLRLHKKEEEEEEEEVTPLASQQGCTDVPGLYIPWS